MTTTKNLLVELFVEELPPKALRKLGDSFASLLADGLRGHGLLGEHSAVTPFASPRRLAAHISTVSAQAADKAVRHKLMPASVGLAADGQATPALLKKLASLGEDAAALPSIQRLPDGKAEALFLDRTVTGMSLAEGLQKALSDAVARLPIPKVMQYQLEDGWTDVQFVRPAHGLVALHGADQVAVSVLGLQSGRQTRGHRFEAQVEPVMLLDADHYARQLEEQGAVLASFEGRRAEISRQLKEAALREGLVPIDDAALLDEVTALVERPNVLLCQFESEFLSVPQECLILTMKANQKYFPLLDAQGRLTHKFLVVSNVRPEDPSRVIEGNERVVRPRLADAKFFFDQDRKKSLESRLDGLAKVVYHGKLGSQAERSERVAAIARGIGAWLEPDSAASGQGLADRAERAARLAKVDLLTDMVGEFPELQGTMGAYYARHDGLGDEIAAAIEDHYKPRFAGDELPRSPLGLCVALADKLETLIGLFGIGQVPSGDKDPFALRRHALGVIRMLVEKALPLPLTSLLQKAQAAFPARLNLAADTAERVADFMYDRLAGALREQGYSAQEVEAVLTVKPAQLSDVPKRLAAVRAFATLPEAQALAAANKRVGNILKKAEAGVADAVVDLRLLTEPAEMALNEMLLRVQPEADAAYERGDYTASLQSLAALKVPVDHFFDQVMVNADAAEVRANRLGLLAVLHRLMNRVADLSRMAG